ncbi:MAG TPA: cbb3-type cytochrome c oxidase subunit II [Candidatus Eisenbacteria bacterium]|nr:cbb3-type cytochrome c oxidase subunit II [Candidatus Eisenbacteria bacterium]
MNQRFAVLLATAAVALAVPLAATVAEEAAKADVAAKADEAKIPAGQKLFLDNGCNSCHSMKGQGIEKKKSATATEATASTPAASPSKIPDLSAVGLEHDQAWMTKFLLKTETLHDKKHMKTWKGTEAELATLTTWLAEQKNAEAAGLKTADKAAKEADAAVQKADEAKQEAKEAKKDADKAADQAKDAKEDAEKAKEQGK